MKTIHITSRLLFMACALLAINLTPLFSQELFPRGIWDYRFPSAYCDAGCDVCCHFNNLAEGLNSVNSFRNWLENSHSCIDAGYDPEACLEAANYCFTMETIPWGVLGALGSFTNAFQLDQLFRINCGNDVCYQCCFANGSCHSSFEGFPVINCNTNYGADASQAGMTLLLSGGPGAPCLFTPQTCEHLPVCNLYLTQAQIAAINNNPNHIMKSVQAKENRRRWLASKVGDVWLNFLNNYGNTDTASFQLVDSDLFHYKPHHIHDFLTGRGGVGWRRNLESSSIDWTQTIMAVYNNDSTEIAQIPSRLRAVHQTGIMRVLSSIPNFAARFDEVESVIWDSTSIQAYLAGIPDPDGELLKYVHPLTLSILKTLSAPPYKALQDYRLFSVPLPGENISTDTYNGTVLGYPPILEILSNEVSDANVTLSFMVTDLDDSTADIPVIVVWGDGRNEKYFISPSNPVLTVTHEYRNKGKYQVYLIAENISGLHAITGVVVETFSNSGISPQGFLAVKEIRLNDVAIKALTPLGHRFYVSFHIGGVDRNGRKYHFGKMSPANLHSLASSQQNSLLVNYVSGAVPLGVDLEKLTIEFEISNTNGGDMWSQLSQINSWWSASSFSLNIWDVSRNEFSEVVVPITPEMITLFDIDNFQGSNSGSQFSYDNPVYDTSNRLIVPFRYTNNAIKIKGIEISIPDSILSNSEIMPIDDPMWLGDQNKWKETKLGYYEIVSGPASITDYNRQAINIECYPNPFTESININLILQNSQHVTVDIFDGLGGKIESLLNSFIPSGVHQMVFTPKKLYNGIYYLKVSNSDTSAIKPLIRMN